MFVVAHDRMLRATRISDTGARCMLQLTGGRLRNCVGGLAEGLCDPKEIGSGTRERITSLKREGGLVHPNHSDA